MAERLMHGFAEHTGLTGGAAPERYLWTDAFAVCNFLGLAKLTREGTYLQLAVSLVEQVHEVLGHQRLDCARHGWLSGLDEHAGALHPTKGGLRIGKRMPERGPAEPFDEALEWHRDGQYFHYLTKWMHALNQLALMTGHVHFNHWARELAEVAVTRFSVQRADGHLGLVWKMTPDLSRPAVLAMGQHDPVDGFITCLELQQGARGLGAHNGPRLETEVASLRAMIDPQALVTPDPLGIGGLLFDALRLALLAPASSQQDLALLAPLLNAALVGLRLYHQSGQPDGPAAGRLAFRELGLAIGLYGIGALQAESSDRLRHTPHASQHAQLLAEVTRYRGLADAIALFWSADEARAAKSWLDHRNINDVMLATSLCPDGLLAL